MSLASGFIFEVLDGGREASVLDDVWVAPHFEFQCERHGLAECPLLEDTAADELPADLREHFVGARFEEINSRDLGLLVELLGFELRLLGGPLLARILVCILQEHLLHQLRVIEALRISFEECDGGERALLRVKVARFLELQQRRETRIARDDPYQ